MLSWDWFSASEYAREQILIELRLRGILALRIYSYTPPFRLLSNSPQLLLVSRGETKFFWTKTPLMVGGQVLEAHLNPGLPGVADQHPCPGKPLLRVTSTTR